MVTIFTFLIPENNIKRQLTCRLCSGKKSHKPETQSAIQNCYSHAQSIMKLRIKTTNLSRFIVLKILHWYGFKRQWLTPHPLNSYSATIHQLMKLPVSWKQHPWALGCSWSLRTCSVRISCSRPKTHQPSEHWRNSQEKYLCGSSTVNPLNPELNPICYLLALLGAHHFLHVSRIRIKLLTLRRLVSYIYGAPILDVSRSHTTTHHSR